jgi:hypothetical protein
MRLANLHKEVNIYIDVNGSTHFIYVVQSLTCDESGRFQMERVHTNVSPPLLWRIQRFLKEGFHHEDEFSKGGGPLLFLVFKGGFHSQNALF